jgi:hypothetical protein
MAAIFTALYLKMLTWDFAGLFFGEYSDTLGDISAKICLLSKSLHFTGFYGNYDWPMRLSVDNWIFSNLIKIQDGRQNAWEQPYWI